MDIGSIRHPKRRALWRNAAFIALLTLLIATVAGSHARADGPVATPDGVFVTGDTTGLNVSAVEPGLTVDLYEIADSVADPVALSDPPPGNFKHTLWGYEASLGGARLLQYTILPGVVPGPSCVPIHAAGLTVSGNGRGVAFDPLDGNLWNTHLASGFIGDGFIHKNTPPSDGCKPVISIPFGDGPGGAIQDDIGALDVDEGSMHIWAAGYKPVRVGTVFRSYIYLVNRNNGKIIQSCWLPFRGGGVGNDTLAAFRNTTLPGSSKYLLTDAGELTTVPNTLALIDQADCHGGQMVTPIMEFAKATPMSGIDFEWPGLLAANLSSLFNNGDQPFTTPTLVGAWGNTFEMEDISLCGFRAAFGGDGNDMCTLP